MGSFASTSIRAAAAREVRGARVRPAAAAATRRKSRRLQASMRGNIHEDARTGTLTVRRGNGCPVLAPAYKLVGARRILQPPDADIEISCTIPRGFAALRLAHVLTCRLRP